MPAFLKNNRLINKGIFALFLIIALSSIFPALVKAEETPDAVNASIGALDLTAGQAKVIKLDEKGNPVSETKKIATIIGNVINIGLGVFTIIFFILIIYGGVVWLTAGGDSTRADKARTTLTNATLGVIVIIIAYLLTNFILFKLIGITTSTPNQPASPVRCLDNHESGFKFTCASTRESCESYWKGQFVEVGCANRDDFVCCKIPN